MQNYMFQKAIEKPGRCPKCGNQTLYHNTGVSKTKFTADYPNGVPWENHKCRCGYLEWVKQKGPNKGAPAERNPGVDFGDKPQSEMSGWQIMGQMQADILKEIRAIRKALQGEGMMPPDEGQEEL